MMSLIAVALMSVVNAGEPAKCTGTTCSAARKVEVSRIRTRTRTKFEQEKNGKVLVPDAWFPWKPSSTNQKFGRKKRCR